MRHLNSPPIYRALCIQKTQTNRILVKTMKTKTMKSETNENFFPIITDSNSAHNCQKLPEIPTDAPRRKEAPTGSGLWAPTSILVHDTANLRRDRTRLGDTPGRCRLSTSLLSSLAYLLSRLPTLLLGSGLAGLEHLSPLLATQLHDTRLSRLAARTKDDLDVGVYPWGAEDVLERGRDGTVRSGSEELDLCQIDDLDVETVFVDSARRCRSLVLLLRLVVLLHLEGSLSRVGLFVLKFLSLLDALKLLQVSWLAHACYIHERRTRVLGDGDILLYVVSIGFLRRW